MRVTRWGEFGILCCLFLAENRSSTPVGASEIADTQGIPLQYAQQILHRLKKGGIIKSARGPKGGYTLSRPPEETNLKDILYAAEGDTFEVICETNPISSERCVEGTSCGLRPVWTELKQAVDTLLESKTLASIHKSIASSPDPIVQIHQSGR